MTETPDNQASAWLMGWKPYVVALGSVSAAVAVLAPFARELSTTTVALALLLVVLFIAARFGTRPAFVASVAGGIFFNFFFLPPLYTMTIAAFDDWVALFAFLITAVTAGQLSARAHRRAQEAEAGRREIERLYSELRDAFDRASRAEALRQNEQLKSALLDAVTHDLRTPLTSIKASVTTLLEGHTTGSAAKLDSGTERELLDVIDEETDRLNHSIGSIVEIARIEAGQMALRRQWTAPDEIVRDALARAARATAGHTVVAEIDESVPLIYVDGRAVSETIFALVDNAAKYAPPGTEIRVGARQEGESEVWFSVEDEGPGIAEDQRDRVFEKFYRVSRHPNEGSNTPSGSGMGLAIARGIVDAHEGRIWIESGHEGRGTRVVVVLPVGDDDAPQELG